MTGFVTLLNIFLSGFFVRRLLKPGTLQGVAILMELPAIFGLGSTATFLFFMWASWFGEVSLAALQAWVLLLGLLWYVFRHRDTKPDEVNRYHPRKDLLVFLVIALIVAVNLTLTMSLPILDWDTRILWALKAKILTAEPTLTGEAFRDPYRLHIHPRYPLLVPFLSSWMARQQGAFLESHYQILIGIFAFLTVWQLYVLLRRLVTCTSACLLTAAMAVTGVWVSAQYNSGVEIPLTLFLLLSITCLLEGAAERQRADLILASFFLFGAAMVKNEGLLLVLCCCLALCAALLPGDGIRTAVRTAARVGGMFLVLSSGWFAHLAAIPAVSDEQYLSRLKPAIVMDGMHRFAIIAKSVMARMSDLRQWHLLWLAPLAALIIVVLRRTTVDRRLLFVTILTYSYFTGIVAVYVISPWRDIAMHIDVTFDRINLPLLPLFILMAALITSGDASES